MASRRRPKKRARAARGIDLREILRMPRMPQLEQHQLDLIGLGLVALAAFFTFVFYLGWDGGKLGGYMADGFIYLFGGVAYLAPLVLFGTGAVLVLRPMLPSVKPFKAGAGCILGGLMLGLAARSFGIGPAVPPRVGYFHASYFRHHGGLVGETGYWVTHTLFQQFGTDIIFLFLMMGGFLLLTGASVAGIVRATGESLTNTTRRVKQSTGEFAAIVTGRPAGESDPLTQPPLAHQEPIQEGPPEVEPVVRATHVEAPALDGERRYPDLYGHDGDEDQTVDQPADDEAELEDDVARRRGRGEAAAPAAAGRADAAGQPPLGGDRGGRPRVHGSSREPAEALERGREGGHERSGARRCRSSWRRSGTSGWTRRSWVRSPVRT